jgi:tRNA(Met) cytidine acetyltransferase
LQFEALEKKHMKENWGVLSHAFALLVNAHYQTSPNDLMQVLDNPNVTLYVGRIQNKIVGSVLVNDEGQLTAEVVSDIQLGKRRPRGHLVPSDLANHLGIADAATQSCARVMRIAVHPNLQGQGIGSQMLAELERLLKGRVDYLATSFGATKELLQYWSKSEYVPLRLGFSVDQSSGTHSVILVRPLSQDSRKWVIDSMEHVSTILRSQLMLSARNISPDVAKVLFHFISKATLHRDVNIPLLLHRYADGGNGLETIRPFLPDLMVAGGAVDRHSDLLAAIGLLGWSLSECVEHFNLKGKRNVEAELRSEISSLLDCLQCKS